MNTVTKRYFIATGEKADQVAKDGLEQSKAAIAKRRAFLDEIGAYGFYERKNQTPMGVVFSENKGRLQGYLEPDFKNDPERNKRLFVYRPDKRTKIGKEIIDRLKGLATFDFSDHAVRSFDVHVMVAGSDSRSPSGMAMFFSVAGYIKEKLVFVIPFGGDREHDTAIPAEFQEIKKSQYIALTEEDGA